MQRHLEDGDIAKPSAHFSDVPLEVLVSWLHDVQLGLPSSSTLAIYPSPDYPNTLLVSKFEEGVWPLPIVVSLQVRLQKEKISVGHLKRGERRIPIQMAAHYFSKESAWLSQQQDWIRAIEGLHLAPISKGGAGSFAEVGLDWHYWGHHTL